MSCYENGSIVQLVPEASRAWHAGVSSWGGDTDINSRSIGIEIGNPGHDFGYPDFPIRQIAAVITLCRGIMTRRIIRRENVAGAFRRGAEPQAGPGREISLEAACRIRRRISGSSRCRSPTGCRSCRATPARRSPSCRSRWPNTATASTVSGDYDVTTKRGRHRVPAPFPAGAGRRHRRHLDPRDAAQAAGARGAQPRSSPRSARFSPKLTRRLDGGGCAAPSLIPSVGWTAAPAITERWPGRKVRAPRTNGAG